MHFRASDDRLSLWHCDQTFRRNAKGVPFSQIAYFFARIICKLEQLQEDKEDTILQILRISQLN